ncbi:MAG TPA: hypothetical protein VE964_00955 [Myxococcales bacterium]|nr:hypothetical protein [Myxococcales bacterium]
MSARETSTMRSSFSRERTIPPRSASAPPLFPVPAPRGTTGIRFSREYRSTLETSSALRARTTACGG